MLFTRSSVSPETGSRGFGVSGSDAAGACGVSTSAGSDFSQMFGMAFLASSARRRHMLSIFASLRGPHLHMVSFSHEDVGGSKGNLVTYGWGMTSTIEPSSVKIFC